MNDYLTILITLISSIDSLLFPHNHIFLIYIYDPMFVAKLLHPALIKEEAK